jgi:hypothetical protein
MLRTTWLADAGEWQPSPVHCGDTDISQSSLRHAGATVGKAGGKAGGGDNGSSDDQGRALCATGSME